MKSTSHVIYKDRGMALIVKNLEKLDGSYSKVGFPSGQPVASGKPALKEPLTNMADVATIAFFNEYGTKNIPARPFMSLAFYNSQKELKSIRDRLYTQVIAGKMPIENSLAMMGSWFAARIKRTIDSVMTPPNAPSTIKAKNAALMRRTSKKALASNPLIGTTAHPLIHTAQMRNSVTHVEVIK